MFLMGHIKWKSNQMEQSYWLRGVNWTEGLETRVQEEEEE